MTFARATSVLAALLAAFALPACGDSAPSEKSAPKAAGGGATEPGSDGRAPAGELPSDEEGAAAVARFAAKGLPIYCGGRSKPWIALTFDDGPGAYTKKVLTLLNRAEARRTFFLNGKNVAGRRSALLREQRSGSSIGNHTWSHDYLPGLGAGAQREEIASTNKAIEQITEQPVTLFRPPYGARNDDTDRAVKRLKMATILWDIDSEDALGANSKQISRRVKQGFRPGSIILLHENRGQTLRALRYTILPALRRSGMTTVTVPQMLAGNPPSERQLKAGRDGCGRG